MKQTCSFLHKLGNVLGATSSNHGNRTVPAWYPGTVSWLVTGPREQRRFTEDQRPVASALSVANVAASHRFHCRRDREMHLPGFWGDGDGEDAPVMPATGKVSGGAVLMRRSPRQR
jgi:hypothetical protein